MNGYEKQIEYLSWEYGMFFHFGIRPFFPGHVDWDGKDMPLEAFDPKELDCSQWIRVAKAAGARVVGTGRSDFPNQINNVLAFPGIFRGALDCRATCINEEMKVATSFALASLISDNELSEDNIIAPALDKRVAKVVAEAVIKTAKETGVARI